MLPRQTALLNMVPYFHPGPGTVHSSHSGRDGEGSERRRYRGYKYTKIVGVDEYWMENLKNYFFEPVVVVYTCNPSIQEF